MGEATCRIEGGTARYLARVLRLGPGDSFAGLGPDGLRRNCEVIEVGPDFILLGIGDVLENAAPLPDTHGSRDVRGHGRKQNAEQAMPQSAPVESPEYASLPRIVLVQALAKGPAMDLIVRQAAEAGVSRIIPLAARRSVSRAEGGREGTKLERWERIAREGLQQSGSPVATTIDEVSDLSDLPARLGPQRPNRLMLLLHEAPLAKTALHEYLNGTPEEIILCVGPEGGFAPDEVDALMAAGFKPLLLPGAVLRAETAALFAVASVEIILSERSSWIPCP
jgi:16S rRNA (uracil1498-N3)-methyltransferase